MADSVHHAILTAAQTAIRDLNLTGIEDNSVLLVAMPTDDLKTLVVRITDAGFTKPTILVSPIGSERLNASEGTNASDDIGYPILIAILDGHKQNQTSKLEQWMEWRGLVIDHFIHNRLTITTSRPVKPKDQTVEPGSIFDPRAWYERNLMLSTLTVIVTMRRIRRG